MQSISTHLKIRLTNRNFLLALAVLAGLYSLYMFYFVAHLPYSGFKVFFTREGDLEVIAIDAGSPADIAGLEEGDKIIQAGDGEIIWDLKSGRAYQIKYERKGVTFSAQYTPGQPVFPYHTLTGFIFGLLFLFLGLAVLLRKPQDPAARVFYLLMICLFLGCIVIFNFKAVRNPLGGIAGMMCYFIPPLFLHFLLIFPERKQFLNKQPFLQPLLYVPAFVLASIHGFLIYRTIQLPQTGQSDLTPFYNILWITNYLFLMIVVYFAIGLLVLAHTFFTTPDSEVKKQLQWIFLGSATSFFLIIPGLYVLNQDLALFLAGGRTLPVVMILGMVLFFLSYVLAILKYRLMDIEIVIHRSLSSFLVSSITVLFYFLLFGLTSKALIFLTGKKHVAAYIISAGIVAFYVRPLLSRIQNWIDKLFYREKYELHQALEKVSQALLKVRNPEEIFRKVFQTADSTLHISNGNLWLRNKQGGLLEHAVSYPEKKIAMLPEIDPLGPLAQHLTESVEGLTSYQILRERKFGKYREKYLIDFEKTNTEIFLPLVYENTLLGLIGLGTKRSGNLYSSTDVRLLTTLANQTAIAMENARAYSRIEQLNLNLEKKVHQIEGQKEEILALQQRLLNENTYLRQEMRQHFDFNEIIGTSQAIKDVLAMVKKIAPTSSTVFLGGESGTGKELIARSIHFNSTRRDQSFIKVNCAAIPANLLESELFGHEKGAFTGAIKTKPGKVELADGGTLFLDEIGDISPDVQVKLLRMLQEKEFERLGGTRTFKADIRIISATNQNIEKAISQGNFREDLFYRLNVIAITLPALRDRREDIRELSIHFISKFSREMGKTIGNITPEAMDYLKGYHWPGNIRELANVLERAVVLGENEHISVEDLPDNLMPAPMISQLEKKGALPHEIERIERDRILEALDMAAGNKSEAARLLGLKKTTFFSKLKKLNIS